MKMTMAELPSCEHNSSAQTTTLPLDTDIEAQCTTGTTTSSTSLDVRGTDDSGKQIGKASNRSLIMKQYTSNFASHNKPIVPEEEFIGPNGSCVLLVIPQDKIAIKVDLPLPNLRWIREHTPLRTLVKTPNGKLRPKDGTESEAAEFRAQVESYKNFKGLNKVIMREWRKNRPWYRRFRPFAEIVEVAEANLSSFSKRQNTQNRFKVHVEKIDTRKKLAEAEDKRKWLGEDICFVGEYNQSLGRVGSIEHSDRCPESWSDSNFEGECLAEQAQDANSTIERSKYLLNHGAEWCNSSEDSDEKFVLKNGTDSCIYENCSWDCAPGRALPVLDFKTRNVKGLILIEACSIRDRDFVFFGIFVLTILCTVIWKTATGDWNVAASFASLSIAMVSVFLAMQRDRTKEKST